MGKPRKCCGNMFWRIRRKISHLSKYKKDYLTAFGENHDKILALFLSQFFTISKWPSSSTFRYSYPCVSYKYKDFQNFHHSSKVHSQYTFNSQIIFIQNKIHSKFTDNSLISLIKFSVTMNHKMSLHYNQNQLIR